MLNAGLVVAAELEDRVWAGREVGRLERASDQSPESGWIRTWLDTVLEIPWSVKTEDNTDIGNARTVLEGVLWVLATGAPWRDLPARYGPWQTVYGVLRRWQLEGTWPRILTGLQALADAVGLIIWNVGVD